jgi:glucokinase
MNVRVVGIDLGGTAMKAGVVGADGAAERLESRPTGRDAGAEAVLERLGELAGELAAGAAAIGVALPGLVDEAGGVARASVNLGWRDVPLRARLEERLGLPVAVAHDVRAAAHAEGAAGAARGRSEWLLVTLGTGVGAAVVLGGAPYGGAHGFGGELGHLVVAPDGPPCGCGARGCVEALASAAAVERRYAERTGRAGPGEEVVAGRGDAAAGPAVAAEEVVARAVAGEAAAGAVWGEAVDALAAGLAAAVVVLDPELIVVGGGLAEAGGALFDPLRAALQRRLPFLAAPPVVKAALGPDAGWRGAALLARELL